VAELTELEAVVLELGVVAGAVTVELLLAPPQAASSAQAPSTAQIFTTTLDRIGVRVSQAGTMDDAQLQPSQRFIHALERRFPFWAPQLIVACAILLDLSLPEKLTLGPTWVLPAVEGALLIGLIAASPHPGLRHSPVRRAIAMGLIGLVSAVNIFSLVELVHFLLHHSTSSKEGRPLILAGIVLWVTNVLLFGLWYWELDRGGPLERTTNRDAIPDFLFPQMTETRFAPPGWMPSLLDYLYVSFTNASAFSPTDTMPLTAAAKVLMTAQSVTALVTIGLVVARAVNILQ
jgi:hypothetical protein